MAQQQTIVQNWAGDNRSHSGSKTISDEGVQTRDIALGASDSDIEIALVVTVARLKMVYIIADQDFTLETNSSSAADESIALKANEPYLWYTGSYYTNLLATDITKIFLTNDSDPATATQVHIEILEDPTP